jgi:hypothetical protein
LYDIKRDAALVRAPAMVAPTAGPCAFGVSGRPGVPEGAALHTELWHRAPVRLLRAAWARLTRAFAGARHVAAGVAPHGGAWLQPAPP